MHCELKGTPLTEDGRCATVPRQFVNLSVAYSGVAAIQPHRCLGGWTCFGQGSWMDPLRAIPGLALLCQARSLHLSNELLQLAN